jgi:hypothetical protein
MYVIPVADPAIWQALALARPASWLEHAFFLFSHWSLQENSCCSRTLVSASLHVQIEMNLFIRTTTSNIL